MPIFITRLVEDSGCRISGSPAERGSSAMASLMRSCTRWRAVIRSVPGLKSITTCDRPTTEEERITSMPGMPRSASSIGIVISSSISELVMPRPSVCTSTLGGANSGNTSTGMRRSSSVPKAMSAVASASTRNRYFRLELMIQENTDSPSVSRADAARRYFFLCAAALQWMVPATVVNVCMWRGSSPRPSHW